MKIDKNIKLKTIKDFGDQWNFFTSNNGYYGSLEVLKDIFGSLLKLDEVTEKIFLDVGAGTGRISNLLIEAGAKTVYAVEPSNAFHVLQKNCNKNLEKIICINTTGDDLPKNIQVDIVISIGVIHHIWDPLPVLASCYSALKPSGKIILWLYGREGNLFYLIVAKPLRVLTKALPHRVLVGLSSVLNIVLQPYIILCKSMDLNLPLKDYFNGHFSKLGRNERILTIYDQLNPEFTKYYTRAEARKLLIDAEFKNIELEHRHGYSWIVKGEK